MKYAITRKWVIFLLFIFFICTGHSFWPFDKRKKQDEQNLSNPRSEKTDVQTLKIENLKEENIIISQDTTWSGKLEINQVVLVKKGARLTINPGTELVFSGQRKEGEDVHTIQGGGMKVEGQIFALGEADKPIIFTGRDKKPGGWGSIFLSYSQDNIFKYCIFEYANYAIHSHFSSFTVSHCLFENNNEGCRLGFSQGLIENSIFRLNESRGINFRAGKNEIRNSSIVANLVGIFIYEKGDQSRIFSNNIFNNEKYNIQLGDFHKEDVVLENIFLGKDKDWVKTIYDHKDDENLGQVKVQAIDEEIHWEDEGVIKNLR